MKYHIIKDNTLSGPIATIYNVQAEGETFTLLQQFIQENKEAFYNEIENINNRLLTIGHYEGARRRYFKDKEGIPGDGVCAIYDMPNKSLRLYCIKYGNQIIIVGGGGPKPKNIKALQEDEKLKTTNYFLRWISQQITERIKNGEIIFTNDHYDFEGNLTFDLK